MMKLFAVNLRLFDGEGGAPAGDGAASTQGESQASPGTTRRGKSGEYANVKFGKQEQASPAADETPPADAGQKKEAAIETTSNTLEDKRKAFRALVNGEYKDQYTEETQRIIDRRFRETRNLEQQIAKQQPVIDMLLQRYKITDGDLGKLSKAVENDDAYWSEAAEEAGMSVEQFKRFQKLERENKELLQAQRASQTRQMADRQLQQWYLESEQVKAQYPGFDLEAESRDPQFLSMLKSGVPVLLAYQVKHMDEITASAAQAAAQQTEKAVVDGIRAKGARPAENGTSSQSAFVVKDDPSKWSKKDRAEIARRVSRGETIKL